MKRSPLLHTLLSLIPKRTPSLTPTNQPTILPQQPLVDDHEAWPAHWNAHGQPWRKEPEIDAKRQQELIRCRATIPDIEKGIYPFKEMKLSRADIEWLLATHENGRGPVDWSDENQRERVGLDLRGANLFDGDLWKVDLSGLPLARLQGGLAWNEETGWTYEQRKMAAVTLTGVNLEGSHLEGAVLEMARLEGANLREADLDGADLDRASLKHAFLFGAQLNNAFLAQANLEKAHLTGTQMEKATLDFANLKGADLVGAKMKKTHFVEAHLEETTFELANLRRAWLSRAHLEGADLSNAHMEGVHLEGAHLEGADLSNAQLDRADLEEVTLANKNGIGPQLADVQWGSTNLAIMKWSQVKMLGDEREAHQKNWDNGKRKDKETRLTEYEEAVRANRQLAVALEAQGMNEEATRFAYRAQVLQCKVFWFQMLQPKAKLRQRGQVLGAWLFSWFLYLLAGYGYRPGRSVFWYIATITGFCAAYSIFGHIPLLPDALVFSLTSFHGRGFFPGLGNEASLHNPLVVLAAAEAVIGLFIEISFIATFTQRFFGK